MKHIYPEADFLYRTHLSPGREHVLGWTCRFIQHGKPTHKDAGCPCTQGQPASLVTWMEVPRTSMSTRDATTCSELLYINLTYAATRR